MTDSHHWTSDTKPRRLQAHSQANLDTLTLPPSPPSAMPISLLRKQPPRRKPDEPVPTLAALSFPSPQPLIDAEWAHPNSLAPPATNGARHTQQYTYNDMVPRSIPIPQSGTASPGAGLSTSAPSRGRLADGGDDGGRSRAPSRIRDATGASPDFHRPFSPHHIVPVPSLPPGISRAGTMRRARQRRAAALTVIVAGPSGAGKTW